MALEITGTLKIKLDVQSGSSARGEWQKQEFVVETQDQYPRQVCFNVWGADKVSDLNSYKEGDVIKVSFNVESREFKERWYTDLRAWRIEKVADSGSPSNQQSSTGTPYPSSGGNNGGGAETEDLSAIDDLPF